MYYKIPLDILPKQCKHKNVEKDRDTLLEQSVIVIENFESIILIEQALV